MGREVRNVPPNWKHPTYGDAKKDQDGIYYCRASNERMNHDDDSYLNLYDQTYESASAEWIAEFIEWHVNGKILSEYSKNYWEYAGNPPDEAYYRTYRDEEATWYQLYQTVGEGTPVSPPFATKEELVEYLVTHGDFWQQNDRKRGISFRSETYSREAAEYMVNGGYAPSMVVTTSAEGMTIESGAEALAKAAL